MRRLEVLAGRLEVLIQEPNPPALVHGDVWSANVLAKGNCITAFLDPALYHADPEIELSFIGLFDSFGAAFFERYAEIRGLDAPTRRAATSTASTRCWSTCISSGAYLEVFVRRTLGRFGL